MKARTIIHPRKMVKAMNTFVNKAHQNTYTACRIPAQTDPNETVEQFLERFRNAEEIECPAIYKVIKSDSFKAYCGDEGNDTLRIGYCIKELSGYGNKQFRKDFENRCPMAKGFADVTIALLHELGHFASEQEIEGYNRDEELKFIDTLPIGMRNLLYFLLPDEVNATNWAIEWLNNADNRKIAKDFEKKFFACFSK